MNEQLAKAIEALFEALTGPPGPQGPQGIQGPKGDFGLQGIPGIRGVPGIMGLTGPQGEQGIQGIQGIKGDKGDKGDKGEVLIIPTPIPPIPPPIIPPPVPDPIPLPVSSPLPSPSNYLSNLPLLTMDNLEYKGVFRLPNNVKGSIVQEPYPIESFDFAETGFAFNPKNNSLFITNHVMYQETAEVEIIEPSTIYEQVGRAKALSKFKDLSEGNLLKLHEDGSPAEPGNRAVLGGLLVHKDELFGNAYIYYDTDGSGKRSHFKTGLDLNTPGGYQGMFRLSADGLGGAFFAGYMENIPTEWQEVFGAPCITGGACYSIIFRTSSGPALFAFDPSKLNMNDSNPVVSMVYYPLEHPTLGSYSDVGKNLYFNKSTGVRGVVFPSGTRSVLFFGSQGTGDSCYGRATYDDGSPVPPEAHNTPWKPGLSQCYDPANHEEAPHTYPYRFWVWGYDAVDLSKVARDLLKPWEVRPYMIADLNLPYGVGQHSIRGAAYDQSKQRIYLLQDHGDAMFPGGYAAPIVAVMDVKI